MRKNFDPQGDRLDQMPAFQYNSGGLVGSAKVTFQVTRQGGGTPIDLPYQLFGAMYGIHSAADSAKFPNINPSESPLVQGLINANIWNGGRDLATDCANAATIGDLNTAAAVTLANRWTADAIFDVGNITEWQPDGSLLIGNRYNTAQYVIISCKELPYKSFLKALEDAVIKIDRVRFKFGDQNTIDEVWNIAGLSMFGSTDGNDIIPTDFFDPNQQQSNVIDVNQPLIIDGETALNTILPEDENQVSYICSVSQFINNNLRS